MKVKEIEKINGHDWLEINNFADSDSIIVINLDKNHSIRIEYIDLTNVKTMSFLPVPILRIYMYDGDEIKWFYEGMYSKNTNKLISMDEVREALKTCISKEDE